MLWARDEVEVEALIRSARSLLTVTMRAMDVGTVVDRIEIPVSATSSDVVVAIAIVIVTIDGNADAVIATAIGTDVGDVGGKRL